MLFVFYHYSDPIMSAMASQITDVSIVCSTVCSGANQRKYQSSVHHWPLWGESTGGFPSQTASNAENVFIWWSHHGCKLRNHWNKYSTDTFSRGMLFRIYIHENEVLSRPSSSICVQSETKMIHMNQKAWTNGEFRGIFGYTRVNGSVWHYILEIIRVLKGAPLICRRSLFLCTSTKRLNVEFLVTGCKLLVTQVEIGTLVWQLKRQSTFGTIAKSITLMTSKLFENLWQVVFWLDE